MKERPQGNQRLKRRAQQEGRKCSPQQHEHGRGLRTKGAVKSAFWSAPLVHVHTHTIHNTHIHPMLIKKGTNGENKRDVDTAMLNTFVWLATTFAAWLTSFGLSRFFLCGKLTKEIDLLHVDYERQ